MSKKLASVLQDCFLNKTSTPHPGEPLSFNTFEKTRGKASIVETIRAAIAQEEDETGKKPRVDEPFLDLTIRVLFFLNHISNYYAGLFTPHSEKDKKFVKELMKIGETVIRNTMFGSVYVGYGEDLIELDKALLNKSLGEWDDAQLDCKFRLYTKNGQGKYHSILAGKTIESSKLDDRLVKFGIRDANYGMEGGHILTEFLGGIERVKVLVKAAGVRTIASVDAGQEEFEKEMQSLLNGEYPVLKRKGTTASTIDNESLSIENSYDPHEFVPIDAPRQLFDGYVNFFDVMSDYLGYGGKASPHKMERLTEQEAYQGSDVVATIQSFLQKRLQSLFDQLAEKYPDAGFPDDFEIMISNRSTAQAILDPEEEQKIEKNNFADIDG